MLESQPSYLDLRLCVYFILSCVLFKNKEDLMFKHMHLLGWDCWYLQHHCDCFTSWGPCRAKVDWEFSLVEICRGQTSIRSARDDP